MLMASVFGLIVRFNKAWGLGYRDIAMYRA